LIEWPQSEFFPSFDRIHSFLFDLSLAFGTESNKFQIPFQQSVIRPDFGNTNCTMGSTRNLGLNYDVRSHLPSGLIVSSYFNLNLPIELAFFDRSLSIST
jgi:hypothetical protein